MKKCIFVPKQSCMAESFNLYVISGYDGAGNIISNHTK